MHEKTGANTKKKKKDIRKDCARTLVIVRTTYNIRQAANANELENKKEKIVRWQIVRKKSRINEKFLAI